MKIIIRANGGEKIGMGHVMRSLVLAKSLAKTNEVVFACDYSREDINKYKSGIEKIEESGFKVIKIDNKNIDESIIEIKNEIDADVLITDSYNVHEEYFNLMSKNFKFTGYIDDVNICRMNVDFIINQNINACELKYEIVPNKSRKLLLGTDYCMLREEFQNITRNKVCKNIKNLLITVGGSDSNELTLNIIKEIYRSDIKINIVIGSAFTSELVDQLEYIAKKHSNINLIRNAKMSLLMKQSDLAISACGSTLYELAAVGVPTIGIIVAENQLELAKCMDNNGLIVLVNEAVYNKSGDIGNLKSIFDNIFDDYDKRINVVKKQKSVNRKGISRLVNEINNIIRS